MSQVNQGYHAIGLICKKFIISENDENNLAD